MKESLTTRVSLTNDGKYRWVYEINLHKDLRFFFLVWKLFFFIFAAVFILVNVSDLINWGVEKMLENIVPLLWFFVGMTVVVGLGYLIYSLVMGGKYIVEFEMDDKGFLHRQIDFQAKKAQKLGRASAAAGLAAGSFGAVSAGVAAQRTEMYTDFSKVKKIKSNPRRNVIKVKESLEHNQVYATDEDFAFVLNFIVAHCPNAHNQG